jgi:hypothetical protein
MHLRRWISAVAAVGLVAHAIALVRHHGAMLKAELAPPRLTVTAAQICHAGGAEVAPQAPPQTPSEIAASCPICAGPGPALMAPASEHCGLSPRPARALVALFPDPAAPAARWALRPPVRGPPARV